MSSDAWRTLDHFILKNKARPTAVDEASLAGALSAAAGAGFDLASEPPLRVHVFALGESEHVILLPDASRWPRAVPLQFAVPRRPFPF